MAWTWQPERADGTVVADVAVVGVHSEFPSQAEAETWVGETWRELVEAGIDQVSLFEDGRLVYGPMSLRA